MKKVVDNLVNLITGVGSNSDPNTANSFRKRRDISRNVDQLEALYTEDPLGGRIIDIKANDATREWRSFTDESPDLDKLRKLEVEMDLKNSVCTADKWSDLYGTSMIVIGVEDGKDPSEPLDIDSLPTDCLRYLRVLSRTECTNLGQVCYDPLDDNYLKPYMYEFTQNGTRVHHSRILRFEGVELPPLEKQRNTYWSDSVFVRLYDVIVQINNVQACMKTLTNKSDRRVVKLDGLQDIMSNPTSAQNLLDRFSSLSYLESSTGIILLDSTEDLVQMNNSLPDLAVMQDKALLMLAAATEIPQTRLLGATPTGLTVNQDGDIKNYVNVIKSRQERKYNKPLKIIDRIMCKHLGIECDTSFTWNNIFQMDSKDIAAQQKSDAERDRIYLQDGVIDECIIAKQLKDNGVYSAIDQDYLNELQDIKENEEGSEERWVETWANPEAEESNRSVVQEENNTSYKE